MIVYDLSGPWSVTLDDGSQWDAVLPGTLDENHIGYPENSAKKWHPDAVIDEAAEAANTLHGHRVISTRFTRRLTYEGVAAFRRQLPAEMAFPEGMRVFLDAERTRKLALTVDGSEVSPMEAGSLSTPWCFEITDIIRHQSILTLRCDNTYQGWPAEAILYASAATDETQTNWNGLLGTLQLRLEKTVYIREVQVRSRGNTLSVRVLLDAGKPWEGTLSLGCEALKAPVQRHVAVEEGLQEIEWEELELSEGIRRWDEEEGNLYVMTVSGTGLDQRQQRFGVRDYDSHAGVFTLNGRRIFLRSEANCCVFPETGHMPLTVEAWTKVLEIYRSYGVNCMRFHSHCPPEAAFEAADAMGMMMQPELSHWDPRHALESGEAWQYYRNELLQILKTYGNHPSFVMLTLGNELHADATGCSRMEALVSLARDTDPTRQYAAGSNNFYGDRGADSASDFYTSSSFGKMRLRGAFAGVSGYINESYPGTRMQFDDEMREIRKTFDKPVFSFEVGQFESLPDFREIGCFQGVTRPDNYELIRSRVRDAGYLDDWQRRVEATGELALLAYREEVEAAMRTRDFAGISLLGLQDFPGQGTAVVGMLDSHLNPKPYRFAQPESFRAFFRSVHPMAMMEKYTWIVSEILTVQVRTANYSKLPLCGNLSLALMSGDHCMAESIIQDVRCPAGSLTDHGTVRLPLQGVSAPARLELVMTLAGIKNRYPVWVYPEQQHQATEGICVTGDWEMAAEVLESGGDVFFTPAADEAALPGSVQSQFTTDFWSVGTFPFQGGCMGMVMDPSHPVFAGFPTEAHTNWQWWPMAGGRAMVLPEGTEPLVTVLDSYARLRHMGMLFECQAGRGRLMASSMGLREKQQYPEARALMASILSYMQSGKFHPEQRLALDTLHGLFR